MLSIRIEQRGSLIEIHRRLEKAFRRLIARLADFTYEEMRRRAPVRTGKLRRSIEKRVAGLKAEIGPTVPYAIFVERGTRPHIITPVRAHALRFEVGGEVIFARLVRHPGTKPQPFVRETAEETARRIHIFAREVFR